jgi:acetylornithine/succinyldiaminopimelate/putrescine aminotransferase
MPFDRSHALPEIVAASGEWLRDDAGREYIDLNAGYGSVWLGHNHPAVTRALSSQLERYAAPGYLPNGALRAAQAAFAPYVPESHFLGGIYSTGMEAMEAALRAAAARTGARDVAGFRGSAHGRSLLTSEIGGAGEKALAFVHSLPGFGGDAAGAGAELRQLAGRRRLAAIVVEPVQMSGGGHEIPPHLLEAVFTVGRERDVPVLFDETLTGLYRCGERYYCDGAGRWPDLLVLGKGMANGFPAAAVLLRRDFPWDRQRVRPGSTFWNHPLACAATASTLTELSRLDARQRVARIAEVIRRVLGRLELRGRGAMWCLGCGDGSGLPGFARRLIEAGVVVSYYQRFIRLLPPLTVNPEALEQACTAIRKVHADTFG